MKRYLDYVVICLVSVVATLTFNPIAPTIIDGGKPDSFQCNGSFGCQTEDITKMYAGYVEDWKRDVKNAFDEAETKVFDVKPTPDIVGPHEDPNKCACKGTGVIVQGDGHKTVCPFHGSKFGKDILIKPLNVLEK
jgi:hypothetical protein